MREELCKGRWWVVVARQESATNSARHPNRTCPHQSSPRAPQASLFEAASLCHRTKACHLCHTQAEKSCLKWQCRAVPCRTHAPAAGMKRSLSDDFIPTQRHPVELRKRGSRTVVSKPTSILCEVRWGDLAVTRDGPFHGKEEHRSGEGDLF
ncbi:hypothetical protein EJ04DRAFT_89929 [Polyplosphaeria fusca]|uniref:Uncharacterized protein n=1 Tax=Polyplosphaeria fusca TaxID=682080 RepID=A0A9P4QPH7_9PLEO|nr:hypothetical protein EJ04DRAFT_89929 [Polyplosphaeria fusca]